ncbi:MAG: AraC family transcriptional regulator ligand-binding domain-containing protein, partial [Oceanococcaceae bacterium]
MSVVLELPTLSVLMAACARSGSDLATALDGLSLPSLSAERAFRDLPLRQIAGLLESLERTAHRQHFPFAVADSFHFDGEPALNTFLTSAASLREALRLLEWVPKLIHPSIRFIPDEQRGADAWLHVCIDDPTGRDINCPVFVEMIIAVMWRSCCTIAGALEIRPDIRLGHAPRAPLASYQAFYGVPPRFDQPCSVLSLPQAVLDVCLPGRMPQAHQRAEQHIRQLLGEVDESQPLRPQVEALLRQQRSLLGGGMDAVAKALHLHPRTMQRRLRAEGCRYSDVLATLRHRLACELLVQTRLDVERISEELGFSDRRSFTQA